MAFVAEQVGTQPIDFKTGAGEVVKGAVDAATFVAAQQKAEQSKVQLENLKMQQDQMKASVFLDYMDKIANSPNPNVKKILQKQYANQHQKMYGQQVDPDTLKAITEMPEFSETVRSLVDQMGLKGAGKDYVISVNNAAGALGLPLMDALGTIKKGFEIETNQEKAQLMAQAAAARAAGTQARFETGQAGKAIDFEQSALKDVENRREKLSALSRNLQLETDLKNIGKMTPEERVRFDDQLIVAYTKMQDPTSVVMPSEYQRTLVATPAYQQLVAKVQKQLGKGILLPKDREAMLGALTKFTNEQVGSFNNYVERQASLVERKGGDKKSIMSLQFMRPNSKEAFGQTTGAMPQVNQKQQLVNLYVERSVPYSVFASKNPKMATEISEAQYNSMLGQKVQTKQTGMVK